MATQPFEGLTPAGNTSHTDWIVDALPPAPPGVRFRIPAGYRSILRIHHPLHEGARWADVAPDLLVPGSDNVEVPWPLHERIDAEEGSLDTSIVDQLIPLLAAATSTSTRCHYGLWRGFGEFTPGSVMMVYTSAKSPWGRLRQRRAQSVHQRRTGATRQAAQHFIERCAVRERWGARDFALFDGSVDDVRSVGSASALDGRQEIDRRSPQWWWPEDRAWFVATEIDDPWTHLAGTGDLIAAVEALDLESVRVSYDGLW